MLVKIQGLGKAKNRHAVNQEWEKENRKVLSNCSQYCIGEGGKECGGKGLSHMYCHVLSCNHYFLLSFLKIVSKVYLMSNYSNSFYTTKKMSQCETCCTTYIYINNSQRKTNGIIFKRRIKAVKCFFFFYLSNKWKVVQKFLANPYLT